jgi:hypothetical protein
MNTLSNKRMTPVTARGVAFLGNLLRIRLNDGREVRISLDTTEWLHWLRDATPQQRAHWSLEPGGFAVYWEELDDGIEIEHLLELQTSGTQFEVSEREPELHLAGVA